MGKKKHVVRPNRNIQHHKLKDRNFESYVNISCSHDCNLKENLPCGLQNLGNTCYLNSVLQAFNASVNIISYESSYPVESPMQSAMEGTLKQMRLGAMTKGPTAVRSQLCIACCIFEGRSQQDAHECLLCILSTIQDEHVKNKASQKYFSELFSSMSKSTVSCSVCDVCTARVEEIFTMSLDIPGSEPLRKFSIKRFKTPKKFNGIILPKSTSLEHSKNAAMSQSSTESNVASSEQSSPVDPPAELMQQTFKEPEHLGQQGQGQEAKVLHTGEADTSSITGCLRSFSRTESLLVSEGNGFCCTECGGRGHDVVNATKQTKLQSVARIFVVHLKRLLPGGKYDKHVIIEEHIDLAEFMTMSAVSEVHSRPLASDVSLSPIHSASTNAAQHIITENSTNVIDNERICTENIISDASPGPCANNNIDDGIDTNTNNLTDNATKDNTLTSDFSESNNMSMSIIDNAMCSRPSVTRAQCSHHVIGTDLEDTSFNHHDNNNHNNQDAIDDDRHSGALTLACLSLEAGAASAAAPPSLSLSSTASSVWYSLSAVIVHQGGGCGGHYIAYVKQTDNNWFYISDNQVKKCQIDAVLSCQAYMLFYTRNY